MTQIVGSVLVRNEDVFVEQSIRNVAAFCDRIYAVDHVSTDRTWEILGSLAQEFDHLRYSPLPELHSGSPIARAVCRDGDVGNRRRR